MPLLDFISLTLIFNLPALCVGLTHGNGFQRPNIILIVADDLGWADVSWRDSTVYTPVLDRLAKEGMILNASYVQSSCSPSRGALMTGKYPFRLGLQHTTIAAGREHYLTDNVTILPQYLKQLGYATHIVGKWHLGFCDWRFTPTYRGFDSFYGYYNAAEGYYSHIGKKNGYDFRNNTSVDWSAKGEYSTYLFAKRAQKILRSHNKSQPLFLYLPFQAVHGPFEVPEHYFQNRCKNISDSQRRAHCGMAVALDEAIGNISRTMEVEGFLNNTLIIFTTDNGGPTNKGSSNWPLRGAKTTLWEGGHRAVAFIHSRTLLQAQGTIYSGLIHIVDWLPTLLAAAGSDKLLNVTDIDGINLWNHIRRGTPSPRDEFVYNIDEVDGNAALRMGRFKLIQGKAGKPDGWYYPPSSNQKPQPRKPRGLKSPDGRSKSRGREPEIKSSRNKHDKNTKSQTSRKKGEKNRGKETNKGKTKKQRPKEVPDKKKQRPGKAKDKGKTPTKEPQIFLFDLEADPAETNNIAAENAKVVQRMLGKLEVYRRGLVPSIDGPFIKKAHPKFYNNTWSPGFC